MASPGATSRRSPWGSWSPWASTGAPGVSSPIPACERPGCGPDIISHPVTALHVMGPLGSLFPGGNWQESGPPGQGSGERRCWAPEPGPPSGSQRWATPATQGPAFLGRHRGFQAILGGGWEPQLDPSWLAPPCPGQERVLEGRGTPDQPGEPILRVSGQTGAQLSSRVDQGPAWMWPVWSLPRAKPPLSSPFLSTFCVRGHQQWQHSHAGDSGLETGDQPMESG